MLFWQLNWDKSHERDTLKDTTRDHPYVAHFTVTAASKGTVTKVTKIFCSIWKLGNIWTPFFVTFRNRCITANTIPRVQETMPWMEISMLSSMFWDYKWDINVYVSIYSLWHKNLLPWFICATYFNVFHLCRRKTRQSWNQSICREFFFFFPTDGLFSLSDSFSLKCMWKCAAISAH